MDSETDEIIEELLKSFMQKFQEKLQESMKRSEFIFDNVDVLYHNLNKMFLNRGGSNIDSPRWLIKKNAAINPKNNDDKCFQYTLTAALNYQNIKNNQERISKIKNFIDQYNWKEISFPSKRKTGKGFN